MSHYKHLTIDERENLYLMRHQGMSICKIAAALNRNPFTISREHERTAANDLYLRTTLSAKKYILGFVWRKIPCVSATPPFDPKKKYLAKSGRFSFHLRIKGKGMA